jgi:hypothetical protein
MKTQVPRSGRSPNRWEEHDAPAVVRTRPSWTTRALAVIVALHAVYLGSPWFAPPVGLSVGAERSWGFYLETTWGRSILIILELAFAVLIWMRSTRRSTFTGRWYQ